MYKWNSAVEALGDDLLQIERAMERTEIKGNSITTKIVKPGDRTSEIASAAGESDKVSTGIVYPEYSRPINPDVARWRITNPITLAGYEFLNQDIEGIYLDIGFYKIQYTLNNNCINMWSGLGLFNQYTKTLRERIAWQSASGTRFLNVKEPGIIAISDSSGTLCTNSFWGVYLVSIFKLEVNPP